MDCLFRPGTPKELADELYAWMLEIAVPAATSGGSPAQVVCRRHDGIAARVIAAAVSPTKGVQ